MGHYFRDSLDRLMVDHPIVGNVRGIGLFLAVELVSDRKTKAKFQSHHNIPARLNKKLQDRGLLYRASSEVLTIGPPLSISRDEIDEIVKAFSESFGEIESELGM